MKKGYVASLAIAAAIILIAGYFVRPKPRVKAESPVQAPPPPTRRGQMRQISDFLAERATEVADHVVYVPSAKASGVVWPDERIVTTAPEPALVSTASVINERQPAPVKLAPPPDSARPAGSSWSRAILRTSPSRHRDCLAASPMQSAARSMCENSFSTRRSIQRSRAGEFSIFPAICSEW